MPGKAFRKELERAAKRGVSIKVILTAQSDVWLSKYAERYLYRWMLRNNILIYEYQPCILHAKMAIADDKLLTIGSYNINNISAYASIELNLDVQDKEFSKKVQAELEEIISQDCTAINSFTYSIKLFSIKQFLQWSAFQVIRFFLTISTFYFRQRE
jgi:cardiolipin synthase A/B